MRTHIKASVGVMVVAVSGLYWATANWAMAERAENSAASIPAGGDAQAGIDVLMRGPIHEAFATQISANLTAGAVVSKKPPEPIDEIVPRVRPDGPDVAWIPGYWAWDDEGQDFIWISGVWRRCPPGQRWVPGYWNHAETGYRWISGTWVAGDVGAINYLPYPQQASLERGPTSPSPSRDSYWIPGSWMYQEGRYRWQPGFWTECQDNWAWMPDHYVWTPRGAIFVRGYWDFRLTDRGLLFAPARFRAGAATQAGVRFAPAEVVDAAAVILHLFERPEYHHYYFGDYYGDQYAAVGIHPWFEYRTAARGYDPLLSYYAWQDARLGIDLPSRLLTWHKTFLGHPEIRPPHTLAALNSFADRTKGIANARLAVLGRPLNELLGSPHAGALPLINVTDGQLASVADVTKQVERLAGERLRLETLAANVAGGAVAVPRVAGGIGSAAENLTGAVLELPRIANPLVLPGVGGVTPNVGVPGVAVPPLPVPGVRLGNVGGAVDGVGRTTEGAAGNVGGTVGGAVGGVLGNGNSDGGDSRGGVLGGILGGRGNDDSGDDDGGD